MLLSCVYNCLELIKFKCLDYKLIQISHLVKTDFISVSFKLLLESLVLLLVFCALISNSIIFYLNKVKPVVYKMKKGFFFEIIFIKI